jgi:hypothetical protein
VVYPRYALALTRISLRKANVSPSTLHILACGDQVNQHYLAYLICISARRVAKGIEEQPRVEIVNACMYGKQQKGSSGIIRKWRQNTMIKEVIETGGSAERLSEEFIVMQDLRPAPTLDSWQEQVGLKCYRPTLNMKLKV